MLASSPALKLSQSERRWCTSEMCTYPDGGMSVCTTSKRSKGFVTLHFSPSFCSGPKMMPRGPSLKEEEKVVDGSPPGPASLSQRVWKSSQLPALSHVLNKLFLLGIWGGGDTVPPGESLAHWLNHTDTRNLNSYLLGRESWSTGHRAVWLANLSSAAGVSAHA